ncbi:hypothetical protein [Caproicibacterium amylolyticum]|uniref:Uncharacterized protein n=1 Tax=Caproicibacterium amylolyticum TaxID=2766537 RepID=A0A7G9WH60_9FIRM|nr:hypothetical protein [Caproicibacterium amylolyticum]QNO18022.1 hypothetical protein H6X83_14090 [Caproicibacterium amylolyticum]
MKFTVSMTLLFANCVFLLIALIFQKKISKKGDIAIRIIAFSVGMIAVILGFLKI